jgi:hypothetical protein
MAIAKRGLKKNLGIPPYGKRMPKNHLTAIKFKKNPLEKREAKFDKGIRVLKNG